MTLHENISVSLKMLSVFPKVINGYLFALIRKHNQERAEKAFLIDSYAMTKVWQGSYRILRKVQYQNN